MESNVRATLEALCRAQNEDYAGLSRVIGRNPAYIQQFIRRGVPRKLDEADRQRLAAYFGIDEERLGGRPQGHAARLFAVPRLRIAAAAGAGALDETGERALHPCAFEEPWLRGLRGGRKPDGLSMIAVAGESMAPTLADGDDILVDRADAAERLRAGIYVLRRDGALIVKRLAPDPAGPGIAVISDNRDYPSWRATAPDGLDVIGRVVWIGRRVA